MKATTTNIADEKILELVLTSKTAERGFRLLVEKYSERLYWQIRRMVLEHEDANDVLQNCLMKVFRGIHKFQGNSKLYTWLYRIAMNETLTFISKKKKKATTSFDNEELNLANQLKADTYFDGDLAQIRLQEALVTLPEKQRQIFNMRYFEEMTYKEISETLGKSVGGLKASFHHAVKKVEAYLRNVETF